MDVHRCKQAAKHAKESIDEYYSIYSQRMEDIIERCSNPMTDQSLAECNKDLETYSKSFVDQCQGMLKEYILTPYGGKTVNKRVGRFFRGMQDLAPRNKRKRREAAARLLELASETLKLARSLKTNPNPADEQLLLNACRIMMEQSEGAEAAQQIEQMYQQMGPEGLVLACSGKAQVELSK